MDKVQESNQANYMGDEQVKRLTPIEQLEQSINWAIQRLAADQKRLEMLKKNPIISEYLNLGDVY